MQSVKSQQNIMPEKTVADFFAGIGLVELGLEKAGWSTIYSVDYSDEKRQLYEGHFGQGSYHLRDISTVDGEEIPPVALAHASFPCTDVSVAGSREGLSGKETSSFWEFVRILGEMKAKHPAPFILLENVEGMLTSKGGRDLEIALSALCELGYALDILLINASHFVPQSRVRLFIIGSLLAGHQDILEQEIILQQKNTARPPRITNFIRSHSDLTWHLYSLPQLPRRSSDLADIVDPNEEWWPEDRSSYLYNQMFERHQKKVHEMMDKPFWSYGTVFRRMRMRNGKKQSTAELRTDGIAGCLRTPKGGSARQILLRAGKGRFDARLLSGRENARLMGADDYVLGPHLESNQMLFGFGDAVCVPVIEWITKEIFNPAFDEAFSTATMPTYQ